MLARFGLQLGQDELRAAHWNPPEQRDPGAPGGILQRMATPWTDPGLIEDDCLDAV